MSFGRSSIFNFHLTNELLKRLTDRMWQYAYIGENKCTFPDEFYDLKGQSTVF